MKNLFLSAAANTLKTADIWEPVSVISCASNFLTMGNKTNEYNYIMKWCDEPGVSIHLSWSGAGSQLHSSPEPLYE